MATKSKTKKTDSDKTPENFSIKNAISHTNKLMNGFDNTSVQIVKLTEATAQKLAKLEEYQRDLRQTLSGITNVAERAVQDAKLAKLNKQPPRAPAPAAQKPAAKVKAAAAPKAAKPAKSVPAKPAKPAKPATKAATGSHIPIRDLVQQFIQKHGTSTASDIYNAVKAQQSTSRASVYQALRKHFVKQGDGVEARYSMENGSSNSVTDDDAAAFIERQAKSGTRDLSLS